MRHRSLKVATPCQKSPPIQPHHQPPTSRALLLTLAFGKGDGFPGRCPCLRSQLATAVIRNGPCGWNMPSKPDRLTSNWIRQTRKNRPGLDKASVTPRLRPTSSERGAANGASTRSACARMSIRWASFTSSRDLHQTPLQQAHRAVSQVTGLGLVVGHQQRRHAGGLNPAAKFLPQGHPQIGIQR